jgi:hypothetical protein
MATDNIVTTKHRPLAVVMGVNFFMTLTFVALNGMRKKTDDLWMVIGLYRLGRLVA